MTGSIKTTAEKAVSSPSIPAHAPDLYDFDAIARGVNGFAVVDETVMEEYQTDGFQVVNNGLSAHEIEDAKQCISDFVEGKNTDFDDIQFEAWAEEK